MIKFFRKIRQNLLSQNRVNKYLIYALGEILLVVIGILIALHINNLNEAKNNKERFIKVLKEIRQDLKTDINGTSLRLYEGKKIDSLVNLILDNKLTEQDYLKHSNSHLFWISLQYIRFDYQKTGFKKFENFQGIIPLEYDSLTTKISNHYNQTAKFYDDRYSLVRSQVKERHDYLSIHYNWYYKLRKSEISDQIINFYMNDPIYKNWVSQHKVDNTFSSNGLAEELETSSFMLLIELNYYLNDTYDFIENNRFLLEKYGKPISSKEDWIGKYKDPKTQQIFSIYNRSGYLFIDSNLIKRVNKDTLSHPKMKNLILTNKKNKNGNIEGIYFIDTNDFGQKIYFEKI